jgi:hypothetical protein
VVEVLEVVVLTQQLHKVLVVLVAAAMAVLQDKMELMDKMVAVVELVAEVEETLLVLVPVELVDLEFVLLLMILFDFFLLESHN